MELTGRPAKRALQYWTEQEPEQGVVLHVPRERA